MNQQLIDTVQKKFVKNTPEIKAGYTVRVHQKIKEGEKERVQMFEGLVIKTSGGKGLNGTFTVRKVVSGVGVEKIFPLNSDSITKIEIKKKANVRRSKLYYMRKRAGKSARLKEEHTDLAVDIDNLHKDKDETGETPAEKADKKEEESKAKTTKEAPEEEK